MDFRGCPGVDVDCRPERVHSDHLCPTRLSDYIMFVVSTSSVKPAEETVNIIRVTPVLPCEQRKLFRWGVANQRYPFSPISSKRQESGERTKGGKKKCGGQTCSVPKSGHSICQRFTRNAAGRIILFDSGKRPIPHARSKKANARPGCVDPRLASVSWNI